MPLITRTAKGEKLTIEEMDGNLTYLESNGFVNGQYISISDDRLFENLISISGNNDISITRTYFGTGAVIAETLAFEPTGSASIRERPKDGTYKISTTTDGNGVDLFVAVKVVANAIVSVSPADGAEGSGYAAGDTITINMKQLGATTELFSSYTLQAEDVDGEVSNTFQILTDGIAITNLPTSEPQILGRLWVDTANGFVLKVSQGE